MDSGLNWSRSCPKNAVAVGLGPTTGACSKASSGCSEPERAGATCPRNIPAPAPAGGACASGKSRTFGLKSGGNFSRNSTSKADWTGANRFWMAVLPQPKRGRLRRQDQAGQRHEVDGGGRRPRCSFGKSTGLGLAGGSDLGGEHAGSNPRAAETRASAPAAPARHRRSGLRQRSLALALAPTRDGFALSASAGPAQAFAQRRTGTAALSQTLEGRTHLRLAGQLPPLGRSL